VAAAVDQTARHPSRSLHGNNPCAIFHQASLRLAQLSQAEQTKFQAQMRLRKYRNPQFSWPAEQTDSSAARDIYELFVAAAL